MTSTATFSALLRTPNEVIDQLEGGDVLLTRRDAEPLRLSKARSAEQEIDTLAALAQLIAASLDDAACDRLVEKLADPFPVGRCFARRGAPRFRPGVPGDCARPAPRSDVSSG